MDFLKLMFNILVSLWLLAIVFWIFTETTKLEIYEKVKNPKTLTACLAFGDGPEFGHLPDLVSRDAPSPGFGKFFISLISSPITFEIHP